MAALEKALKIFEGFSSREPEIENVVHCACDISDDATSIIYAVLEGIDTAETAALIKTDKSKAARNALREITDSARAQVSLSKLLRELPPSTHELATDHSRRRKLSRELTRSALEILDLYFDNARTISNRAPAVGQKMGEIFASVSASIAGTREPNDVPEKIVARRVLEYTGREPEFVIPRKPAKQDELVH